MIRMDGICFLSRNVFGEGSLEFGVWSLEFGVWSLEEVWGGKGLWFSPADAMAYAWAGRY